MEILGQLLMKIPEGWPRAVVLFVVVAIYAFPTLRGHVSRRERQRSELEHLRRVLEVKKLVAELEVLGQSHDLGELGPGAEAGQLRRLLRGRETEAADDSPLPFSIRLQPALAGSVLIAAFPVMAVLFGGMRPPSLTLFVAREVIAVLVGTLVATLIPAARRRQSFLYGLLLPVAVGLVSLLARGPNAVEFPG